MSQEIRNLEPKNLWNKFADLNEVPRPSKKEDRIIEFMKNFGKSLGLETFEDEIRNVIIRKPATSGMENRKPIVLQGHLDMVHQKNKDQYFTVKYTNGQGHCNFTPSQTGKAFDELRTWVKTGVKAQAGFIE